MWLKYTYLHKLQQSDGEQTVMVQMKKEFSSKKMKLEDLGSQVRKKVMQVENDIGKFKKMQVDTQSGQMEKSVADKQLKSSITQLNTNVERYMDKLSNMVMEYEQ